MDAQSLSRLLGQLEKKKRPKRKQRQTSSNDDDDDDYDEKTSIISFWEKAQKGTKEQPEKEPTQNKTIDETSQGPHLCISSRTFRMR